MSDNENKELSMDEIKSIMIRMMVQFDEFCTKNNLRYYLAYGTLLGAIRHKGFIPWDDDVDVFMPREDYDRLLTFSNVSETIKIVSHINKNGCWHPFCYSNLIDTTTSMVSVNMGDKSGKGVFIDIFPVDNLPKNNMKRKIHIRILRRMLNTLWWTLPSKQKGKIKKFVGTHVNPDKLADKIDKKAKKYNKKPMQHLSVVTSDPRYNRDFGGIDSFEPYRTAEFEGHMLRIPNKTEEMLTIFYGDYMQLPPESQRNPHHNTKFYRKKPNNTLEG